jgi:RNA polymerase sigma-70 factor (ECF subfamily)
VRGQKAQEQGEGHSNRSDADLVLALARGDHDAFAALVARHFDTAFRIAWRMTGGHADCEDMVQEAFLRLWSNPHCLRDGQALRAWLMRVVSNLAIDRMRRKPASGLDDIPELPAAADKTAERVAVVNEVDRAIAMLPERQRMALILVYYEAASNGEAAQAMETSVEAVESLLARARRNLKASLAPKRGELFDNLGRLEG